MIRIQKTNNKTWKGRKEQNLRVWLLSVSKLKKEDKIAKWSLWINTKVVNLTNSLSRKLREKEINRKNLI